MDFYSGFVKYYDLIFPFRKEHYDFLAGYLSEEGNRILDLGCGTGKMVNALSKNSTYSCGIDLDEEMIRFARVNFPDVDFYHADILDVDKIPELFSLIYSTGNVFSYFHEDQLNSLASKIYNKLKPGGICAFQTVNWNKFTPNFNFRFPELAFAREDLIFRRIYKYNSVSRFVNFEVELEQRGKSLFSGSSKLYPRMPEQTCTIFKEAGFNQTGLYGNFSLDEYRGDSPAAIYVFTKD